MRTSCQQASFHAKLGALRGTDFDLEMPLVKVWLDETCQTYLEIPVGAVLSYTAHTAPVSLFHRDILYKSTKNFI